MSNALEAMAKAKWEAAALRIFGHGVSDGNGSWAALGQHGRDGLAADMRPVLLALSEVELSDEQMESVADAYADARASSIERQMEFRMKQGLPDLEKYGVAPAEWLPAVLSAICRSIAEEGK